jgi:glycosyltransferase involved in cell wall biosynthesis
MVGFMRLLHVYAGNLYGGIESVLVTFARNRGLCPDMEPHFALCFEGRLSDELRDCGATVHLVGPAKISRPWTVWRVRKAMRRLLSSGGYDFVVTHGSWVHGLFAPVVRSCGRPLAFWVRDLHQRGALIDLWAMRNKPDVLLCNSQVTSRSVEFGFKGITPVVVYNPIASPELDRDAARRDIRAQLNTPEYALAIVQACRMERWKGHGLLLDALAMLKDVPDWVCWVAGGPQRPKEAVYFEELQKRCARLGLAQRIRWLGQRRDVPALLAAADIYCQPNTAPEPFGNVFVEALLLGLPVVTTAIGGACEIVAPGCGDLVPPSDPSKLAAALLKYIRSPELRLQAAGAGPRRASELCDPARQLGQLQMALVGGRMQYSPGPCA